MKIQSKQWIQIAATICLMFIGDLGDHVMKQRSIKTCRIIHALLDNFIHAFIGILSWIVVDPYSIVNLSNELIAVGLGASFIDLDHFIAAKSLRIEDAFHAPSRGPFHCSGLLFIFSLVFIPINLDFMFVMLTIFVPHHLRDSIRRGIYLYPPLVHTKPIPINIVRILLVIFPWFIRFLRVKCDLSDSKMGTASLFSSFNV